jgi:thioredoxin-like negative regulator of GroEL
MAGNGIVEVTDANFDQDVLKSETPVLLGNLVRALPRPCSHRGRVGEGLPGQT